MAVNHTSEPVRSVMSHRAQRAAIPFLQLWYILIICLAAQLLGAFPTDKALLDAGLSLENTPEAHSGELCILRTFFSCEDFPSFKGQLCITFGCLACFPLL